MEPVTEGTDLNKIEWPVEKGGLALYPMYDASEDPDEGTNYTVCDFKDATLLGLYSRNVEGYDDHLNDYELDSAQWLINTILQR